MFQIRRRPAQTPQFTCDGTWVRCTPESAARFSAVAYFFAREIRRSENVPIGLIGTYASGTKIEPWISLSGFTGDPRLRALTDEIERIRSNWEELNERYQSQTLPTWQTEHDAWMRQVGESHREAMRTWNEAAAQARAAGQPVPARPRPVKPEPRRPDPPSRNPRGLSVHFNAMVAPIIPYAIKGVLWYQGESNADKPDLYRALFPALIADWRRNWNQAGEPGSLTRDFPFLFVQLANFVAYPNTDWPALRDAQHAALAVAPNTAMAVAIDVGMDHDIHPKNKLAVGQRLSLAARNIAYGHPDVVYEGPTFASMSIDRERVRVRFDHVAGGLVAQSPPTTAPATASVEPMPTILGFELAGEDGHYRPAVATLDGPDAVVVSAADVPRPVAVRYAWANTPRVNLYNSASLPAVAFQAAK
jgi:sialate O-acetylesterase